MEKISIVRRRKKGPHEPGNIQSFDVDAQALPAQELTDVPIRALKQSSSNVDEEAPALEGFPEDNKDAVSFKLTPEQYNLVKSSQYVKYFLNGESSGVSMDVEHCQDGQIVFNFQFRKVETVKMLKSEHVCQMLQISKSFLMRLVKSQEIKSYKIGRLRRFLLEDIIDYLSRSKEIFNCLDA
ncbi:MAG: helix-turn-helix domain-containing protein [Syntrophales bacterium]